MIASRRVPNRRIGPARALSLLALAGGIVIGAGHGAEAQFLFEGDILPPRVIAWRLADRGFSGMTRPRYDGRVYVVVAVDPAGVPMRLFVDPAGGAIVGRQRLAAPDGYRPQDYARLERPAPGFGWTEDESGPRRAVRPLPPEEYGAPVPPRAARRPAMEAARPDPNPSGLNPDAGGRPEAPRKVARAAPPAARPDPKPAVRAMPDAPPPRLTPAEAKPETPASTGQAAPAATPSRPAPVAEAPRTAAPDWKDPPAEGRRPVRVIEGATVVPGTTETKDGTP